MSFLKFLHLKQALCTDQLSLSACTIFDNIVKTLLSQQKILLKVRWTKEDTFFKTTSIKDKWDISVFPVFAQVRIFSRS